MADRIIQTGTLQNIADAIRTKDGTSADIQVSDFAQRIEDIPSGSGYTIDEVATAYGMSGAIELTVTRMRINAFYGCTSITSVKCDSNLTISTSAFYGCSSLKHASFPFIQTNTAQTAFGFCYDLKIADMGSTPKIEAQLFRNDSVFNKLIIRKTDSIATLANVNAFQLTPFVDSNKKGILYCPASLKNSYETGTNWSSLVGLEVVDLVGSRFENANWIDNLDGTVSLDGQDIDIINNETVAIFKHTENISHVYDNGVELADSELMKNHRTVFSTV